MAGTEHTDPISIDPRRQRKGNTITKSERYREMITGLRPAEEFERLAEYALQLPR
jgi:hypothetical protein